MKTLINLLIALIISVFAVCADAQTTEFTYQGNLRLGTPPNTTPATGNYDFEFRLYDADMNGTQLGMLTRSSVAVDNGSFSVKLDFGAQFPGANRYLAIGVRQTGGGAFMPLTPRQQLSSAPYAVRSLNAASADSIPVGGLPAGSGNYIQNQNASAQSANFNISGNGIIGGNLGIGTIAPQQTLHVDGLEVLSTGSSAGFKFRNRGSSSSADDWVWYSNSNIARFWRAGFGDIIGVSTTGNVGIGTTTPSSKLEVNGDVKVTGTVTGPRTNMTLDIGGITPGGTPILVPGLSQTVVVSGNAKLLVQFGVRASRGSCIGCNANNAYIEVTLNGNTAYFVPATSVAPNSNVYISGSWLMSAGQGSHTVQITARTNEGSVTYGCGCVAHSHLIVQVIPE